MNREKKIRTFIIDWNARQQSPGYGLFEFSGHISLSSAYCGRYGEVMLRVEDAFYWPSPLSRGGRCRQVSIRVNARNVGRDEKSWPLW